MNEAYFRLTIKVLLL